MCILADTTKEHFSFTIALGMRTFVVITKIDMCQAHSTETVLEQVKNLLHSYKKVPTVVKDDEEVLTAAENFLNNRYSMHYSYTLYIHIYACIFTFLYIFLELFQYLWSPVQLVTILSNCRAF